MKYLAIWTGSPEFGLLSGDPALPLPREVDVLVYDTLAEAQEYHQDTYPYDRNALVFPVRKRGGRYYLEPDREVWFLDIDDNEPPPDDWDEEIGGVWEPSESRWMQCNFSEVPWRR